jgi:hypothetical protein
VTWLLTILGTVALLAVVALVTYAVALRRKMNRDLYCKMTCVGGSEMGRCPCVSPRECKMVRKGKVAS